MSTLLNINNIKNTIIQGHTIDILKEIPEKSIDIIITSPPYFGFRNYNTNNIIWDNNIDCDHEWNYFIRKGITGGTESKKVQIKGKKNFQIVDDSVQKICLKCNAWSGELGSEPSIELYIKHLMLIFNESNRVLKDSGCLWINIGDSYIKKVSMGIPDRLKIKMIDNGWFFRNEIIWYKPNVMPTSAKDRFTVDFEKFYFFTKNSKYYFKQQFEPYTNEINRWGGEKLKADGKSAWSENTKQEIYRKRNMRPNPEGRNMRSVWKINTASYKGAHFATFPEELVKIPILSGCPDDGIVLDIFVGSGTTCKVAKDLNRNYIGIELNSDYIKLAEKRLMGE
jgi:site-specific DNA-methyltransferase (adenine-specific)